MGRTTNSHQSDKYKIHAAITERNRRRKKEKWDKDRKHWKENSEYQNRQEERKKKIETYARGPRFTKKEENERIDQAKKIERKRRNKLKGRI